MGSRGLAYRRHARQRAIARAKPVVRRIFGDDYAITRALKWADNLRKCSCPMCARHWGDSRPYHVEMARRGEEWGESDGS